MSTLRYSPVNLGRWILWGGTALVFLVAPHRIQRPRFIGVYLIVLIAFT